MISSSQAVDLAAAIYDPIDKTKFDTIINVGDIICGVKLLDDTIIFSFAGTETFLDFIKDACMLPVYHKYLGVVAQGFLMGVDTIYKVLSTYLKSATNIAITGHSLGCAHGLLIVGLLIKDGFTVESLDLFAPPKVCDFYLHNTIMAKVANIRAFKNGIDLVPELPLSNKWHQFNLIHLDEEPEQPWQLDPISWHSVELYAKSINAHADKYSI